MIAIQKYFLIFVMLMNSFAFSNEIINASESCGIPLNGAIHKHTTVGGIYFIHMGKCRRWSKEDDRFIKKNYNLKIKSLSKLLYRTIPSIKNRKKILNLTETFNWSKRETNILKRLYESSDKKKILMMLPNRGWSGILAKAKELRLRRDYVNIRRRNSSNISILLNDSLQSNYYMGLLMADGYFTNERISLSQSLKDKKVVINYANYIGSKNIKIYNIKEKRKILGKKTFYNGHVFCGINNSEVVPKLLKKYCIIYEKLSKTKTYYPPSIKMFDKLNDDKFLSYLIGFIDGDGCISKTRGGGNSISIGVHKNWINIFEYWRNRLEKIFEIKLSERAVTIDDNSVIFKIYNYDILHSLLSFIKKNNLTVNPRKWNRIK